MISTDFFERIKRGDRLAWNQWMEKWYPRIFRFVLKYTNNSILAEEAVQHTFIKAFKGVKNLKDPNKLKSWIYAISINCAKDQLSKKSKFLGMDGGLDHLITLPKGEKNLNQQEINRLVRSLLNKLPGEQKEVIILKEYEEMTFKEIAQLKEQSENTIKSRCYYGLKAMAKELEKLNISKEIYYER